MSKFAKLRNADWINLTEGEEILEASNPSRWSVGPAIVVGFLIMVAGPYAAWRLGDYRLASVSVLGLILVVLVELNRRKTWYVLTDEEVYRKHGIIATNKRQARYDKLQDKNFNRAAVQRLLGYGNIRLTTAGTDTSEFVLQNVPNANRYVQVITEQMDIAQERQYARDRDEATSDTGVGGKSD